ncbi:hypothetical protein LZ554_004009 [Drepanopeziza brunnea f. sp. 'monogermtubi']|nr:hypothetical protein LZ554_004009 [Drepanopeziza brunnea f. sp. 'monogermtubi']
MTQFSCCIRANNNIMATDNQNQVHNSQQRAHVDRPASPPPPPPPPPRPSTTTTTSLSAYLLAYYEALELTQSELLDRILSAPGPDQKSHHPPGDDHALDHQQQQQHTAEISHLQSELRSARAQRRDLLRDIHELQSGREELILENEALASRLRRVPGDQRRRDLAHAVEMEDLKSERAREGGCGSRDGRRGAGAGFGGDAEDGGEDQVLGCGFGLCFLGGDGGGDVSGLVVCWEQEEDISSDPLFLSITFDLALVLVLAVQRRVVVTRPAIVRILFPHPRRLSPARSPLLHQTEKFIEALDETQLLIAVHLAHRVQLSPHDFHACEHSVDAILHGLNLCFECSRVHDDRVGISEFSTMPSDKSERRSDSRVEGVDAVCDSLAGAIIASAGNIEATMVQPDRPCRAENKT